MNILERAVAFLVFINLASSQPPLLHRLDVDQWVGSAVHQIRRGHNGYAFGGPSVDVASLYCELSRESVAHGILVRARILTMGRHSNLVAQHEWMASELAPDLQRAFGMNHRINLEI